MKEIYVVYNYHADYEDSTNYIYFFHDDLDYVNKFIKDVEEYKDWKERNYDRYLYSDSRLMEAIKNIEIANMEKRTIVQTIREFLRLAGTSQKNPELNAKLEDINLKIPILQLEKDKIGNSIRLERMKYLNEREYPKIVIDFYNRFQVVPNYITVPDLNSFLSTPRMESVKFEE